MKFCRRCLSEKPTSEFSPLRRAKDGLHSWCKPCCADWRRKDRKEKPDRYREIERKRHDCNGEARRAGNRKRWGETAAYREKARRRWLENRDVYNRTRRERLASDVELRQRRSEKYKEWRERNAAAVSERNKDAWANASPTRRLRSYFGAAIAHALNGAGKGGQSWQRLVGYTADQLRIHIERQFSGGMTWENYGLWHIDHIIPAASFSYQSSDDPDFKACWALTNLRPLWAKQNISKGCKRTLLL